MPATNAFALDDDTWLPCCNNRPNSIRASTATSSAQQRWQAIQLNYRTHTHTFSSWIRLNTFVALSLSCLHFAPATSSTLCNSVMINFIQICCIAWHHLSVEDMLPPHIVAVVIVAQTLEFAAVGAVLHSVSSGEKLLLRTRINAHTNECQKSRQLRTK